jgi:hypothetical protein
MITRMLEELGLFVGKKKEPNHEALFFQNINKWLLYQSGGAWDYPEPIYQLLKNREVKALVLDYIQNLMKTPRVASFLGWKKYLKYRTPLNLDIPWGWKDPRNTYTLPIWLELFPDAKVISIYRHGVDVANSLKIRQDKAFANGGIAYRKRKPLYFFIPKRGRFTDSVRCTSLEGGFSLWEEYFKEARAHVNKLGEQCMEIKYEDFVIGPCEILKDLSTFCKLPANETSIAKLTGTIQKERAYAYQGTPELKAFADSVAIRLKANGY